MRILFNGYSRNTEIDLIESFTWYIAYEVSIYQCGVIFGEEPKGSKFIKILNLKE